MLNPNPELELGPKLKLGVCGIVKVGVVKVEVRGIVKVGVLGIVKVCGEYIEASFYIITVCYFCLVNDGIKLSS